jgi:ABC-2 type transport system permease protein
MLRILTSIHKEFLILIRDKAGLAILFVMPMILIFVMTLIQDTTYKKLDDHQINVLFLDLDKDSLGFGIEQGLLASGFFSVVTLQNNQPLNQEIINRLVSSGEYQIGIVVMPGTTQSIRDRAQVLIEKAFVPGYSESESRQDQKEQGKVIAYFDPVIKNSFKQTVLLALQNFITGVETKINFDFFAEELANQFSTNEKLTFDQTGGVQIEEQYARTEFNEIIPNSVQHNVPAWAVFAMFFIIIPLTGNIIRERQSGSILRLKLVPGSYLISMTAKITVYILVCLLQFSLMILVGIYILPLLGTPVFDPGAHKPALLFMAFTVALAATGYGVMIGTIATSHDQAASFGSVSVIILAALGGIWVPVFVMPKIMQEISVFSPLNWALDGFYTLLLRGGGFGDIWIQTSLLIAFFAVTLFIAYQVQRMNRV